ncbi:MAG: AAA family ATPase, partial [Burkholderiales bacterium]|nr:AAA family ATPase [Burkholderiales bacterium]
MPALPLRPRFTGILHPVAIVAVFNQKGGVGKTTTALNLLAAFGQAKQRPLAVDLDAQ